VLVQDEAFAARLHARGLATQLLPNRSSGLLVYGSKAYYQLVKPLYREVLRHLRLGRSVLFMDLDRSWVYKGPSPSTRPYWPQVLRL